MERVKTARYFVCCFNVGPDSAASLRFRKNQGGEFAVKYMAAAFNKDVQSGEFFLEFEDCVDGAKVIEGFHALGAGQVCIDTFGKDGGESAANALLRIMTLQGQTGFQVSRGCCPKHLKDKVEAKQKAAAQQALLSSREFDEKTAAALKASLDGHTVKLELLEDGIHAIGDCMESHKVKLEAMEGGMEFQKVKLEAMEGGMVSQKVDIVDIKQGVCSVMPELHERIKQLEKEVEYHKTQRDSQEGKTARQTARVNAKDKEIAAVLKREEALIKREEGLLARIKELENALLVANTMDKLKEITQLAQEDRAFAKAELAELKQSIADAQENAKALGDMLAEERAAKRQRF
jgi:hypothetical protein